MTIRMKEKIMNEKKIIIANHKRLAAILATINEKPVAGNKGYLKGTDLLRGESVMSSEETKDRD